MVTNAITAPRMAGVIGFDGNHSCAGVGRRDRFDTSPQQARAIAWATEHSSGSGGPGGALRSHSVETRAAPSSGSMLTLCLIAWC